MKEVEGIILIISCQKHLNTRLKKFKLPKNNYDGWEVLYVVGDLFLCNDHELRGNMLYIKCEDSYIHLLKKVVLSIKYVNELFAIRQGILRCGDDLIYNNKSLLGFLKSKKYDFYGKGCINQNSYFQYSKDINSLKNVVRDQSMYEYYMNHIEDFSNPQHNLQNMTLEKLRKFSIRPRLWGPVGVIYYLSNKACKILVSHMENINYDVFHLDSFTNSYPYTIEDVGATYIMYYHGVRFFNNPHFFDTNKSIARHTNEFK